MYNKGIFLDKPVGNNAFSFEERENKKLYIPELIEIDNFDDIKLQDDKEKIAFEDFDFDDKLSTNYGLKNFYKIKWKNKDIYLFDNHNHAFAFWYLARSEGIIGNDNTLVHVDEHADTRDNNKNISREDSLDLEKVFKFTNEVLNVGDYIIPAENEGIIKETIQIRNTQNLEDYEEKYIKSTKGHTQGVPLQDNSRGESCIHPNNFILNLDLDFFQPDLDFIDYDLKKKVVLDAAEKSSVITVATSPFFIDQNLAIKVFKDIFR